MYWKGGGNTGTGCNARRTSHKQTTHNNAQTHTATTHEYDDEGLQPTSHTDDPHQTNEQNHSKDVLNARKVDAENRAELPRLLHQRQATHSHALKINSSLYS